MEKEKFKRAGKNVAWVAAGILGGGALALLALAGMVWGLKVWGNRSASLTDEVRPLSDAQVRNLLAQAEASLRSGNAAFVRDQLLPNLDRIENVSDRARAFRLLGDAEKVQGRPQMASGYYQQLYDMEPTGEHLSLLADAYYAGGDRCKALSAYRKLLDNTKAEDHPYLKAASERARELEMLLIQHPCDFTPTP